MASASTHWLGSSSSYLIAQLRSLRLQVSAQQVVYGFAGVVVEEFESSGDLCNIISKGAELFAVQLVERSDLVFRRSLEVPPKTLPGYAMLLHALFNLLQVMSHLLSSDPLQRLNGSTQVGSGAVLEESQHPLHEHFGIAVDKQDNEMQRILNVWVVRFGPYS